MKFDEVKNILLESNIATEVDHYIIPTEQIGSFEMSIQRPTAPWWIFFSKIAASGDPNFKILWDCSDNFFERFL